jgi:hypothetical protein
LETSRRPHARRLPLCSLPLGTDQTPDERGNCMSSVKGRSGGRNRKAGERTACGRLRVRPLQSKKPRAVHTVSCSACGVTFDTPAAAPRRCCSDACRKVACGTASTRRAKRHTCVVCAAPILGHRHARQVCCSRACGWKWMSANAHRRKSEREANRIPKPQRTCRVCTSVLSGSATRLCSNVACRKADARARENARNRRLKPLIERACKDCSKPFTPAYGCKRRRFCSDACLGRYVRRQHRRTHPGTRSSEDRARAAGVKCDYSIRRFKVFERDGWRCHLCGCATPKRLNGTLKPNAPELDHIVPIGVGGGHTWDNVACACRSCNHKKGAKVLGQLRLAV